MHAPPALEQLSSSRNESARPMPVAARRCQTPAAVQLRAQCRPARPAKPTLALEAESFGGCMAAPVCRVLQADSSIAATIAQRRHVLPELQRRLPLSITVRTPFEGARQSAVGYPSFGLSPRSPRQRSSSARPALFSPWHAWRAPLGHTTAHGRCRRSARHLPFTNGVRPADRRRRRERCGQAAR